MAERRAPKRPAPLAGVRIVSVEQYGAGPLGTLFLADLGADVIKVEDPATGGDVSRYIPPRQEGTDSLFNEAFNRGKRSIVLDLKNAAGRAVFERLVASADAVFSNLRGDQAARLGLTYERLGSLNPRIVCVALTGYGRSGPQATLPAYDALIQAEAGWAALTGEPGGPPEKSGLSLADYVAGLSAVLGLLAGVLDARATGQGRDVDTNLYDAALAMLGYRATWYLSAGVATDRRPLSAHPSVVPFQFFATADGYIALACPKEKFFVALADALETPDLARDPRYATFAGRDRHRDELLPILAARFAARSTEEWMTRLRGRVPIAPVRGMAEALDGDELAARDMLGVYEHPVLGTVRSLGLPIRLTDFEPAYRAAPTLGGDAADLLREAGYDEAEVDRLAGEGAFGSIAPTGTAEPVADA
jgi:crotonobetainyl-CoA:carnitine CoA-transferase CaiB-like acyl-CoA transferase